MASNSNSDTDDVPDWVHEEDFRKLDIVCPVCMAPVYEKTRPRDDYVEQRCENYENGCQRYAGDEY